MTPLFSKWLFLPLLLISGALTAQHPSDISLQDRRAFIKAYQQQYSHPDANSPNAIIRQFRQPTGRSSSEWNRAKLEAPVCELRAVEGHGHTFVDPPENFYGGPESAARAADDCSNVVVTYNFPPEISQERRDQFIFAYEYAVAIWESQLSSPVDIKVEANFLPLAPGVLGSAGPNFIWNDGVVWYGEALADQLSGVDLSLVVAGQDVPDIISNFSTSFGWYLGTDGQAPPGTYDFVTVVIHELCHGLGFFGSGFALSDLGLGIYGQSGLPFIYDVFVENSNGEGLSDIAPPSTASANLATYLTSNDLFIDAPSVNAILGVPGQIFAPFPFNQGSSFSHWDETSFPPGSPNSLMTPFLGFQEANHNPGAITLGMFNDHGWALSTDCEAPESSDLSERCDISGISFDPNFPGPVCDNPGVFSEDGGVFGPVGSHVVCFRVEGIDPFNQPLDPSGYSVKIKGKEADIIALGYDYFEDEPYFYICVGGVDSDGKKNLQVKIKLAPGCTYTEPKLYDSPDCSTEKSVETAETLPLAQTAVDGDHFAAYPNPSRGVFTLDTGWDGAGELIVINSYGQKILQRRVEEYQRLELDLRQQPSGVYFLQLVNGEVRKTKKILIER